jgi:hypothetical protein
MMPCIEFYNERYAIISDTLDENSCAMFNIFFNKIVGFAM